MLFIDHETIFLFFDFTFYPKDKFSGYNLRAVLTTVVLMTIEGNMASGYSVNTAKLLELQYSLQYFL